MLVFPEPVIPKRSLVGLMMSFSSLRDLCWAELRRSLGGELNGFGRSSCWAVWGFDSGTAALRRFLSMPMGRSRFAVDGRGER